MGRFGRFLDDGGCWGTFWRLFLAMDALTTFLLSRTSQGEEPLDTGGGRVFSSPSMPRLVFWPLPAPRRWRCFSALRSALVVWVVWYERYTKTKKIDDRCGWRLLRAQVCAGCQRNVPGRAQCRRGGPGAYTDRVKGKVRVRVKGLRVKGLRVNPNLNP